MQTLQCGENASLLWWVSIYNSVDSYLMFVSSKNCWNLWLFTAQAAEIMFQKSNPLIGFMRQRVLNNDQVWLIMIIEQSLMLHQSTASLIKEFLMIWEFIIWITFYLATKNIYTKDHDHNSPLSEFDDIICKILFDINPKVPHQREELLVATSRGGVRAEYTRVESTWELSVESLLSQCHHTTQS